MKSLLLRALPAALPLLGLSLEARTGFLYGALVEALLLGASVVFLVFRPMLPQRIQPLSFLLLLVVLGVIVREYSSASSLFVVSLLLLLPPQFFRAGQKGEQRVRKMLQGGLAFWALLAGHGMLSEFLSFSGKWEFFQHPAGSYSAFALLLLWLRKG